MYLLRLFFVALLAFAIVNSSFSGSSPSCGGDRNAHPDKCSNQCMSNCNPLQVCAAVCRPGCSCNEGYIYDSDKGLCVIPEHCSSCGRDENAYPSDCCNQCVNNCNQKQICPSVCERGCSCKKGYLYDNVKGQCVLPKQCTSCAGDVNAIPSNCSNHCTNNCNRDQVCLAVCERGCSCREGFIYDNVQRLCVIPEQCTSCGGDKNAYPSDCCNHCTSNCNRNKMCTLACVAGCSCKKGFLYDDHQGQCVVPSHCSNHRRY